MIHVLFSIALIGLVLLARKITMETCAECKRDVPPMCTFSISKGTQTISPLCMQCMKKLTNTIV